MVSLTSLAGFALIALGIVLTPGPNMAYVVSRALTQGRAAGLLSLTGVANGLIIYMLLAAFGLTTILLGSPTAFNAVRLVGAAYLGYLAWQSLKPGGSSPFEVQELPKDSSGRLYVMGLLTCLLNPKVAMLYVALLPQFVRPERGHILEQTLLLGSTQICIAVIGNGLFVLAAFEISKFLQTRPGWRLFQRYVMGVVLGLFSLQMIGETIFHH